MYVCNLSQLLHSQFDTIQFNLILVTLFVPASFYAMRCGALFLCSVVFCLSVIVSLTYGWLGGGEAKQR